MTLSVDLARRALSAPTTPGADAAHETTRPDDGVAPQAAVATILRDMPAAERPNEPRLEALFIKRAVHERDPWSGHMAFPGGRRDPSDTNLLSTAKRETLEEVGVDLDAATLLGPLPPLRAVARRHRTNLTITPFVFAVHDTVELKCDPSEVAQALWLPLGPMYQGTCAAIHELQDGKLRYELPAFRMAGHTIWGLTYQMLQGLFGRFHASL